MVIDNVSEIQTKSPVYFFKLSKEKKEKPWKKNKSIKDLEIHSSVHKRIPKKILENGKGRRSKR